MSSYSVLRSLMLRSFWLKLSITLIVSKFPNCWFLVLPRSCPMLERLWLLVWRWVALYVVCPKNIPLIGVAPPLNGLWLIWLRLEMVMLWFGILRSSSMSCISSWYFCWTTLNIFYGHSCSPLFWLLDSSEFCILFKFIIF